MTRKSTSGGWIHVGNCTLLTFSRRQSVIAQSSGEAEYYAGASAVSEGLLIQEVLKFAGADLPLVLQMDASAAVGMCTRQGVDNVRHLNTKLLWVQQLVQERKLRVEKIPGAVNGADIGTKVLDKARLYECMRLVGLQSESTAAGITARDYGSVQALRSSANYQGANGRHLLSAALAMLAMAYEAKGDDMAEPLVVTDAGQASDGPLMMGAMAMTTGGLSPSLLLVAVSLLTIIFCVFIIMSAYGGFLIGVKLGRGMEMRNREIRVEAAAAAMRMSEPATPARSAGSTDVEERVGRLLGPMVGPWATPATPPPPPRPDGTEEGTVWTAGADCWHKNPKCYGLRHARKVSPLRPCQCCAVGPQRSTAVDL